MPSVQSTSTAPGALSAGASSSTQRRSSTGAWRRAASSSRSLIGAPRGGGGKWRVVVGRPLRRPTRSPTDPPGAGEVASGRAGGDLAGRSEGRQGLEGSVGEHLLLGRGVAGLLLGEVGLPGLEVPDLGAAPDADHGDVALEAGGGAQERRERDAALLAARPAARTREEDAQVVASALRGHGGLAHGLELTVELGGRQEEQAALLTARHDQAARELGAELRGEQQAALVVETGR